MDLYLFIHIDKTGGSSIEKALNLPDKKHRTALDIKNRISESLWNRAFKFSIVRNPWDRTVSQYFYRLKTNQLEYYKNGTLVEKKDRAESPISFEEWVKEVHVYKNSRYHNNLRFFMPQFFWISNSDMQIITDYTGRFENLENDFREICRIIDIKTELPHINKSERNHYHDYYTAESREIIGKYYYRDLNAFEYTF